MNFFDNFPKKIFSPGRTILQVGGEMESVYYVRHGVVRSFYTDENGNEFTVNLLKTGSIFPLSTILSNRRNLYEFEAFDKTEIAIAPQKDFFVHLESNPNLKDEFLRKFASALEGFVVRSLFLIKGTALQRVSSTLLMLEKRFGKDMGGSRFIDLSLTHQNISDLAGITRETASLQIGILKNEKVIKSGSKRIVITDIEKLREMASIGDDIKLQNLSF